MYSAYMSNVGDILSDVDAARAFLEAGDAHVARAMDDTTDLHTLARRAGELLQDAGAIINAPPSSIERRLLANTTEGMGKYGEAAGSLMALMFGSGSDHLHAAADSASRAVEMVGGSNNGERMLNIVGAVHDAAAKIAEAQLAVQTLYGMTEAAVRDMHLGQSASAESQEHLLVYRSTASQA